MMPEAPAAMAVTSVKLSPESGFIEAKLQVTVPAAPTAGVVQTAPPGAVKETNVVCGGVGASTMTLVADVEPELFTVYRVVRLLPAFACWGAWATTESPGKKAPKESTYASPQWPPSEQPAPITCACTVSPMAIDPAVPGTSTTCQFVYVTAPPPVPGSACQGALVS